MSRQSRHGRVVAYPRGRPRILPFQPPTHASPSMQSTERFELEVPECSSRQVLDFRFFPPGRARDAVATANEMRIVLPTGSVLLVAIQPVSRPAALRIAPLC